MLTNVLQRPNQFKTILRGVRQQYMVDQICKVKSKHLEYLHHNQMSKRVADYTFLCDQMCDPRSTDNELDLVCPGRFYILPSTYVGEDCYI